MPRVRWVIAIATFVLLLSCNLAATPVPAPTTPPETTPTLSSSSTLTCDQIISQALQTTGAACNALSRNQACYGNRLVTSQVLQPVSFEKPGDVAQLTALQQITTSALNEATQIWGVALLEAQANIPDTLPGQNVTFILFGETSVKGITPDMQAVTLSTGIGQVSCAAAPRSAILIQSPDGTKVSMKFNGASVTLGSTIYITAVQNGELTLATLEGAVVVEALGASQTVLPGAQTRLQLGSTDGLQVVGPPSPPQPYNLAEINRTPLTLLKRPVQPPAPISAVPPTLPVNQPPTTSSNCFLRTDWTGTYTVQPGDTLLKIARRYNVTLTEIQNGNCIADPNIISVGQVLRVPFIPPTPTPTPAPTLTPTATPTLTNTPVRKPQPTNTSLPFPTDTKVAPAQTPAVAPIG
jgi:hypothetical protein